MLRLISLLSVVIIVTACKFEGEIGGNDDGTSNAVQGIEYKAYCKKLIKVKPQEDAKSKILKLEKGEEVIEGDSKRKAQASLYADELLLEVSYELHELSDGSREIKCSVSDGSREFKGDNEVRANAAYISKNACDITYDLDRPSHGGFTFEYQPDWAWINYYDEENGYSFNIKFRNSECVEL